MKVAILGYGQQGRSAYEYWREGNEITICDSSETLKVPPDTQTRLGVDYLHGLDQFDSIVRSPSIHPRNITAANSPAILDKVTTVTNEFFRVCPSRNLIGVTGTKGKGTTSTLIAKMLEADGRGVHLGGNIGIPPLDLLKDDIQPDDWIVLELANFQLIDLQYSPRIAVCLMVAPEHLDWHGDDEEYFQAKGQLFRWQTENDTAIYYADNETSKRIANSGAGKKIPYYAPPGAIVDDGVIKIDNQAICKTDKLKLLGRHNWQNACAAATAVWQVSQNADALRSVLTSFSGLPFRIELRREANGVRYYNDSFASQPSATIAAVESIPGKKVMIVGGFERNLDLNGFADSFGKHGDQIRRILLIGASAKRIAEVLQAHGLANFTMPAASDMPAIVQEAAELAEPGDAVILSPGFASFDMFKNFEDRGRQFNEAVEKL